MAEVWDDYALESQEQKHAFDKLLRLLDDVNFRLPGHGSEWDEHQKSLIEQLERCSQVWHPI